MDFLAFGTYDVGRHPRFGVLLEGLREHGDVVHEVVAPLGIDTAGRVAMLRQPWRLPLLAGRLAWCWSRLAVRGTWAYRRPGRRRPDAVLVGYLGHFDVLLARLLFPRATIVLDHLLFAADTAADRGVAPSRRTRVLAALDRRALAAANVVVLDTEEHRALVPGDLQERVLVVPVGAPGSWFAAGDAVGGRAAGPLRAVFFGLFTPLQGTPALGAALGELADDDRVEVTVIGTGQDYEETRALAAANPRVTWSDWVAPADLPALVAGHDVCLGIFGDGPKGRRVVPNKVYQGAAAGCAVLTSDTAPQRGALGPAAVYVEPGRSAPLTAALRDLAAEPVRVAALRTAAAERARARFTPRAVVVGLRERLDRRLENPTSGTPTSRNPPRRALVTTPSPPPLPPRAWLRYDVVRRWFDRLQPRSVLEVGCGQGAMGARLAALPSVGEFLAVEPDPVSYAVAESRITAGGGHTLNTDHTGATRAGGYDLVCAFEVLEHLDDDRGALAGWVDLVAPGGHLMLSVPAFADRFAPMDTVAGHFRRYDPSTLTGLLQDAGLTEVDVTVYGWPLGYALEAVRNRMDSRALASEQREVGIEERTMKSGRHHQPGSSRLGAAVAVGTAPFRGLQRLQPRRGTGLVAVARRPA